ncbi:MAG: helix-turn-helix domain-containing protein [Longimicrobiales bacterium]
MEASVYFTRTIPIPAARRNGPRSLATTDHVLTEAERIVEHFVRRGVVRPEGRAAHHLRSIFAAPPEALRVDRIARRVHVDRATLARHFRAEGIPSPREWITLARALYAHRTFLRGGTLQSAAYAAGYSDTFTMSSAFRRITGLRPSRLRDVDQKALLDVWIIRQRDCGALTGPPPVPPRTCPICGGPRAS